MSVKALADYTQYSKYARYLKDKQRRETWNEQVERVFNMHKIQLGEEKYNLIKDDFEFAKSMLLKKRILGSQRALQFGGDPILKKNTKIYNCCASYVDRPRFFQECLLLLLSGCGTGMSVQKHHIKKLPKIRKRDKGIKDFVIPDSIEGWSDAVGILMSSYFDEEKPFYVYDLQSEFDSFSGYKVNFDYSMIRPEGSPISWGGIAPGPNGLKTAIEKIEKLLDSVLEKDDSRKLKPIEVYDIVMHMSDAVLSGGIRRSAVLTLFSPDDNEMATCKTGNWFIENPQRGRSNNSALLLRNETKKEDFSKLMTSVKEFGEPGFIWSENSETLYNPCVTGDMLITTSEGIKTVKDLIGKQFNAVVDGKKYKSTEKGFFKTGYKKVYKLKTKQGFSSKSTNNHEYLVYRDGEKIWKQLKDIDIGEYIVVNEHKNIKWPGKGTFKEGWLLGSLYGDGNLSESHKIAYLDYWGESRFEMQDVALEYIKSENLLTYHNIKGSAQIAKVGKQRISSTKVFSLSEKFGISPAEKMLLNNNIEKGSYEFCCGFLRGWFDADGSVQGNLKKGVSIRLCCTNYNDLQVAQRILLRMGIYSKIYKGRQPQEYRLLPDGKSGYKEYFCKETHELIISRHSMFVFEEKINFNEKEKSNKLRNILSSYKRTPSKDLFIAQVESKECIGYDDVYDCTINDIHAFDANGIYVHNCSEISFISYDDEGNSGWGFCNLTEINGKKAKTEDEFYDACRAASILGTIQATYTNFDYLDSATKKIVERDALLGVSITGMMDNPDIMFNPEIQKKGSKLVLDINDKISKKLGINNCARGLCIKPSGTASCILGTSSGIHPQHAKRYIRRVQANKLEFPLQKFQAVNPLAVEDSVWSNNKTDSIISFLCEVPDGAKTKNQLSAIEFLEYVKLTQQNWVEYGTRKNDDRYKKYPWLRHNVSNTINVCDYEWDEVEKYIYKNRKWFAGISLVSRDSDKDYPQSPFTTIFTPTEMVREYGDGVLMASGLIVDGLHAFNNNLWAACDCALGIGEKIEDMEPMIEPEFPTKNGYTQKQWNQKLVEYTQKQDEYLEYMEKYESVQLKNDWVRRVKQFAERYVGNDLKKCTYLLKDTHNWKLWCDLKREYKDIDWSTVKEEREQGIDVTKIAGAACSGGNCDLGELGESIKANKESKN